MRKFKLISELEELKALDAIRTTVRNITWEDKRKIYEEVIKTEKSIPDEALKLVGFTEEEIKKLKKEE